VHSVASTGVPGVVRTRTTSCGCSSCTDGTLECLSNAEDWKLHVLQKNALLPEIDRISAIRADDSDRFYLMKVQKIETLKKQKCDDYHQTFRRGTDVVEGYYYDNVDKNGVYNLIPKQVCKLLNDYKHDVYLCTCLQIALVPRASHLFCLPKTWTAGAETAFI